MANNPQLIDNRFAVFSPIAHVQALPDVGIPNANLTDRHKCTVSTEEIQDWQPVRDCQNRYIVDENLRTRGLRTTFAYPNGVTPQIMAFWAALFFGSQVGPTGTPANEVQTIARIGSVSSGGFKLQLDLEGRVVTTGIIQWNASTAEIQNALTATRMFYIHIGDVVVSGDWTTGMVVTFQSRLGKANLPLMTVVSSTVGGGGSIGVTQTAAGAQNYFQFSASDANDKARFSFVVGYETVTDRFEKYVGFVCEQWNVDLSRRSDAVFSVTCVGPWEPEILTTFAVPECVNPDGLETSDCRVSINNVWETTDVNTQSTNLNDNVPVDVETAYGWDAIDIQDLERGLQPSATIRESIFASETDPIYQLALEARTQEPIDHRTHFGMPGNRITVIATDAKVKFQSPRISGAGTLNRTVVNLDVLPYSVAGAPPVTMEAYLDQAVAFLQAV